MKYLFVITGVGLGHCTREDSIIRELLEKDEKAKIQLLEFIEGKRER